jgi:hypothetical protein
MQTGGGGREEGKPWQEEASGRGAEGGLGGGRADRQAKFMLISGKKSRSGGMLIAPGRPPHSKAVSLAGRARVRERERERERERDEGKRRW